MSRAKREVRKDRGQNFPEVFKSVLKACANIENQENNLFSEHSNFKFYRKYNLCAFSMKKNPPKYRAIANSMVCKQS